MCERFIVVFVMTTIWMATGCGYSQADSGTPDDYVTASYSTQSAYVKKAFRNNEKHPFLYYGSNYKTMSHLDKDIALYYTVDTPPENVTFVVHGMQRARSGNCEHATINALKALQENAKKIGADTIINLQPFWEGESLKVGNSYFCVGGGIFFGIDWEGDFVRIEQPEQEPAGVPGSQNPEAAAATFGQPAAHAVKIEAVILISLTEKGEIIYNDKIISKDYLQGVLDEKVKTSPDTQVLIQPDEKTESGIVVEIMDMAKAVGFANIGLASQQ